MSRQLQTGIFHFHSTDRRSQWKKALTDLNTPQLSRKFIVALKLHALKHSPTSRKWLSLFVREREMTSRGLSPLSDSSTKITPLATPTTLENHKLDPDLGHLELDIADEIRAIKQSAQFPTDLTIFDPIFKSFHFLIQQSAANAQSSSMFHPDVVRKLFVPLGLPASAISTSELMELLHANNDHHLPDNRTRLHREDPLNPELRPYTNSNGEEAHLHHYIPQSDRNLIETDKYPLGTTIGIAIDSADVVDVDDAVSSSIDEKGRLWVHVHVADPTRVVLNGSELAQQAERRASTVYLPENRYPMLPSGANSLGLDPQQPNCHVVTFSARIDEESGDIVDYNFKLERIPIVREYSVASHVSTIPFNPIPQLFTKRSSGLMNRLTYEKADALMFGDSTEAPPEVIAQLRTLFSLAQIRRRYRALRGSPLQHNLNHIRISVDADSNVRLGDSSPCRSHFLVEELMITAGQVAGAWAREHKLPIAYRTQKSAFLGDTITIPQTLEEMKDAISAIKLSALKDNTSSSALKDAIVQFPTLSLVQSLQLRMVSPHACLSVQPERHFSLSIDGYARVTSPLRRFEDVISHWQMKGIYLHGKNGAPIGLDGLQERFNQLLYRTKSIDRLSLKAHRYWISRYFLQQLPDKQYWKALVYEISGTLNQTSARPTRAYSGSSSDSEFVPSRLVQLFITELDHTLSLMVDKSISDSWESGDMIWLQVKPHLMNPNIPVLRALRKVEASETDVPVE